MGYRCAILILSKVRVTGDSPPPLFLAFPSCRDSIFLLCKVERLNYNIVCLDDCFFHKLALFQYPYKSLITFLADRNLNFSGFPIISATCFTQHHLRSLKFHYSALCPQNLSFHFPRYHTDIFSLLFFHFLSFGELLVCRLFPSV